MAFKKRQKVILAALVWLGGKATTRQIAERVNLNVNGVSQSLGAMYEYVKCLGGRGGETKWKLKLKTEYHSNAQGKFLVLRIRLYDSVKYIAVEDVEKWACDHDGLTSDDGRCWDCGTKRK